MRIANVFPAVLLFGLAVAIPISGDSDSLTARDDYDMSNIYIRNVMPRSFDDEVLEFYKRSPDGFETFIPDAVTRSFDSDEIIELYERAPDDIKLTGFGTFSARARAAKTGTNPKTGEAIKIPAAPIPAFRGK